MKNGIPWQESLDQSDYPSNVEGELADRINRTAFGTKVLLAIDIINSSRDDQYLG